MGTGAYPWERYGLIVELTARMKEVSSQFGKTAMQKMVYLLQAVYGVDFGYNYRFYTYGPYSADLSRDLKIIEHHGGIEINFINSGVRGFVIRPGINHFQFRGEVVNAIRRVSLKIDLAIDNFGLYNTRELELRSTIIYADRDSRDNNTQPGRDDFIRLIHNLKPHFKADYIADVIEDLEKKGFIDLG